MDSQCFRRNWLIIILVVLLVLSTPVTALADYSDIDGVVDITPTIPSEINRKSSSIGLLQSLSDGKPFHNIVDYIGFKNITRRDMDAIKWSFILSQLAEPLEESMEDVLNHDIILQMRDKNLEISTGPLISDKDYSYESINTMYGGEEFKVKPDEFKVIHETMTKNLRYSKLWDKYGNQYNVRSLLDTTDRKNQIGYVSDFVYTNKSNTVYEDNTALYDQVENLYRYDNVESASNLLDLWRNPEKLIKSDGKDVLTGQRRLIPVLIGSNVTDMYYQIAMTMYCKRKSAEGMTFERFIAEYGGCSVYVDSFGNIVFFDQSLNKYKMILPNACNPVFTSPEQSNPQEELFDSRFYDNLRAQYDESMKSPPQTYGVPAPYDVLGDYDSDITSWMMKGMPGYYPSTDQYVQWEMHNPTIETWNEQTFIYNKWLAAGYSTSRRTRLNELDDRVYDIDDEADVTAMYYPSYLGPIEDSRIDYRNSVLMMKPAKSYINMFSTKFTNYRPPSVDGILGKFRSLISSWFKQTGYRPRDQVAVIPIDESKLTDGNYMTVRSVDNNKDITSPDPDFICEKYYDPVAIMYNTMLAEGTSTSGGLFNTNQGEISANALKTMWALGQMTTGVLIQGSSDSGLTTNSGMDLLAKDKGGGFCQFVYDKALLDVSTPELLGEEGGYLKEGKQFVRTRWETVTVNVGTEEKPIIMEIDVPVYEQDYSAWFWTKRDNRLSNRFVNYPSDDVAVLSYVWLYDYLPKTLFATFFEGDAGEQATNLFLSREEGASENYQEEYVLLPFNVKTYKGDQNPQYTINACTIPNQPYDDAGSFYEYHKKVTMGVDTTVKYQGENGAILDWEEHTPCTNSATVNAYALIMAIYKNTDTQYNVNNTVQVLEVEKEVDSAELMKKVSFAMDNNVLATSNVIASYVQYIHNAIGVKVTAAYTMAMQEDFYTQAMYTYIVFSLILIIVLAVLRFFKVLRGRSTIMRALNACFALILMVTAIPVLFNFTQSVNRFLMASVMEDVVDKTTLISVQKSIDGLTNTEAVSERNWQAYRQQFSDLEDVFDDGYITIPRENTVTGVGYERVDIDTLVRSIKYLGSGTDTMWYQLPYTEDAYPLYTRYSDDITKYFYDNIMGNYMSYFDGNTSTDQGVVVSQYRDLPKDETTTQVVDRLDRLFHNLKGGAASMFYDRNFMSTNDVLGVARFFNQPIEPPNFTLETETVLTNIKVYAPLLERSMRGKKATEPFLERGVGYITPYSPQGLELITEGERKEFLWELPNIEDWKHKPTDFEHKLADVNGSAQKRIKSLLKYRSGSFSDTAIMYSAAIITVDELAKKLTDLEYGPPNMSDNDKIFRLIYSKRTDDIYNSEALMYVLLDQVKGGGVLTIFVVLMEIGIGLVNILSIIACAYVAIVMPICVFMYYDGVTHLFYRSQMWGIVGQLGIHMVALYFANLPLKIGVLLSNTRMTDFALWGYTILSTVVVFSVLRVSVKMIIFMAQDLATAGGTILEAKAGEMFSKITNSSANEMTVGSGDTDIELENADISINSYNSSLDREDAELRMEESQGQGMSMVEMDRAYMEAESYQSAYNYPPPASSPPPPVQIAASSDGTSAVIGAAAIGAISASAYHTSDVSREYGMTEERSGGDAVDYSRTDGDTYISSTSSYSSFDNPNKTRDRVKDADKPIEVKVVEDTEASDIKKSDEEDFNVEFS